MANIVFNVSKFEKFEKTDYHNEEKIKSEEIIEDKIPKLLKILGKKHAFKILTLLMQGEELRFNEIVKKIDGNVKTITNRLKEMNKENLLLREFYDEIPPRVEYSINVENNKLDDILKVFEKWIEIWRHNLLQI